MNPSQGRAAPDRRMRLWLAFAVFMSGLAIAAVIWSAGSAMPLMAVDTPSYIAWSAGRTPAYPLLLRAVALVSPDYAAVPAIQYLVLVAAMAAFADALACLFRQWLVGLASALAVFGNYFIMRYPGAIIAETLYLGLVLAHAACVLHSLRGRGLAWPVLAGVALGGAILARPAGYALLFGLAWLPFAWRGRRWMQSGLLVGGVAAMILLASAGNYIFRGYFATQAFGGINLILKIAPLAPPQVPGFDPVVTAQVSEDLRPVRDSSRAAASWEQRTLVDMLTFNSGWAVLTPAEKAIAADPTRWQTGSPYWQEIALNALSWDFARKVIIADPQGYVARVVRQFYGMWFVPALTNAGTAAAVADILTRIGGFDRTQVVDSGVRVLPSWAYVAKMIVFAIMLAASIYVVLRAIRRREAEVVALAYFSALTHCYFAVVAGVEVALPRYSLMAWPFQSAIVIGAAALWFRELRLHRPSLSDVSR